MASPTRLISRSIRNTRSRAASDRAITGSERPPIELEFGERTDQCVINHWMYEPRAGYRDAQAVRYRRRAEHIRTRAAGFPGEHLASARPGPRARTKVSDEMRAHHLI